MTIQKALTVRCEMERLETAISALEKRERRERPGRGGQDDITACRESAAVRRASMDLTRALSELRKP